MDEVMCSGRDLPIQHINRDGSPLGSQIIQTDKKVREMREIERLALPV